MEALHHSLFEERWHHQRRSLFKVNPGYTHATKVSIDEFQTLLLERGSRIARCPVEKHEGQRSVQHASWYPAFEYS